MRTERWLAVRLVRNVGLVSPQASSNAISNAVSSTGSEVQQTSTCRRQRLEFLPAMGWLMKVGGNGSCQVGNTASELLR